MQVAGIDLGQLPDLSNASIPLSTILAVAGGAFLVKWAIAKVFGGIGSVIKGAFSTIAAALPVHSMKVASSYTTAILFALGGATGLGYGISTTRSDPSPPQMPDYSVMYKEALGKLKDGNDTKAVETLMKEYKTAAETKYEREKVAYDAEMSTIRAQGEKTPGVPFMTGGLTLLLMGIGLGVVTARSSWSHDDREIN